MSLKVRMARRLVRGLLETCAAILTGLLVFDWILAVAILNPVQPQPTIAADDIPAERIEEPEDQDSADGLFSVAGKIQESESVACRTHFAAVLEEESGPVCLDNPTNQMAHWGPPTNAWLRHNGGVITATAGELIADRPTCACLAKQEPYRSDQAHTMLRPVSELRLDDQVLAIQKWVCADSCLNGR